MLLYVLYIFSIIIYYVNSYLFSNPIYYDAINKSALQVNASTEKT